MWEIHDIASTELIDPPEGSTVLVNVRIFDGISDDLDDDMKVLVVNNRIDKVFKGELVGDPDHRVIDCGGKVLMPGLIDSHAHLTHAMSGGVLAMEAMPWDEIGAYSAYAAREYFSNGFTTVRDPGGLGTGLKKVIDRGLLPGPRIYSSGSYISQTSGHADFLLPSQTDPRVNNLVNLGIIQVADGPDEVAKAARRSLARGASQIKLMVGGGVSSEKDPLHSRQFTDAEIAAAVEAAEAWGTYVLCHVYHDAHIRRALALGIMSIEHGHFITEDTAKLLKDKGAFHSLNLASMSPELFKHPVYGKPGSPQRIKSEQFQDQSKNLIDVVKKVGQKVLHGSDVVFLSGTDLRRTIDFEKWVHADNFGNLEALRAMTSRAGELAMLTGENNPYPHKLGVIEEGAYADILVVDGNPLDDITVIGANPKWFDAESREEGIDTIRLIMKDGEILKNNLSRIDD